MEEYFVIILHGCEDDQGNVMPDPVESIDLKHYPQDHEIEEGLDHYRASYAKVEKRYRMVKA